MTVRRVRVAALAGLAAGVLPLAGCTSVPDSSSPRVVQQLNPSGPATEQGVLQDTRPGVGATEVQIVDGFIGAQPAWQDGHEPARRFLTTRAAAQWRDDASMTVAATRPTVTASDYYRHVVSVTFTPVGTVAQDGSYLPVLRAGRSVTWPLKLRKQAGEWRIDSLPAGTLLSRAQFDQSYQAHPLYFLDPGGSRLVADQRYLPDDQGSLVQQLVHRLIDGPSHWLQPVLGTDLKSPVTLNRVSVDQQVVHIDLAALNAQVSDIRQGAVAQLVWTLTQLTSVFGVAVTSDGQRVDLGELTSPVLVATDLPGYDPDALPDTTTAAGSGRSDTQPGRPGARPTRTAGSPAGGTAGVQAYYVRDGTVFTLDGRQVLDGRYRLSAVGVSTDLRQLAGVGPAPSGPVLTLLAGPLAGPLRPSSVRARTLTRPSWNRATGTFWTVADGRAILAVTLDGEAQPVGLNASWLGRPLGPLGPLRLARDGIRVAFAAGPPGQQRLYVGRVRSTTRRVTVEEPVPVTPALVDVRDVAWESSTTLVVLGAKAGGPVVPWRVQADGSSSEPSQMPPVSGMQTITAAPDVPPVGSGAAGGGSLLVNQGTWVSPGRGTVRGTAPTYPG